MPIAAEIARDIQGDDAEGPGFSVEMIENEWNRLSQRVVRPPAEREQDNERRDKSVVKTAL